MQFVSKQSSVTLSIFQEFVSALEKKTVEITKTNFKGLQQLCKEFGFDEFSTKLSQFFQLSEDSQKQEIGSPIARMRSAFLNALFQLVVNGSVIDINFAQSLIFPAVREQLSVDGCAGENNRQHEFRSVDST
jgi:hypothetical protein